MRCKRCLQEKPSAEFYASNNASCKPCIKKAVRVNRLEKIDYYRQYDRVRSSAPHRLKQNREIGARWRALNPDRKSAQSRLWHALRSGKIVALPCFICGAKAEAHHPDYSMPLDVVWLCPPHHKQAHAMGRKAA
jgi:transcription elongation factor Elf1